MSNGRKVAVLFERLGPYHVARLRAAAAAGPIVAVELFGKDDTYSWDVQPDAGAFARETLFATQADAARNPRLLGYRVENALDRAAPDAVAIPGWAGRGPLTALRWCARRRTPAILMCDSTELDFPRSWWREALKKRLVRMFSSALVSGTRSADYVRALGMPPGSVFSGFDVVDNGYFSAAAAETRRREKEQRMALDVPEDYFLCSARFVPKKNLVALIQAFAAISRRDLPAPWSLVLLGDGPLRSDLEREIRSLGLEGKVRLAGFQDYSRLPGYLALARALVLPSTSDQWGLVVNEAMAAGLPVLVSQRCGCAPDLVQEGVNGFTFDPFTVSSIEEVLNKAISRSSDLADMGRAGAARISTWGLEAFARGLWSAAEDALRRPGRRISVADRCIAWGAGHR